jgi:hypothetical protein
MPEELYSLSNAGRMILSTEGEEILREGKGGFIPLVFADE